MMSRQHEYQYQVASRQALFNERVSNATREHLDRYQNILNDVREQDLAQYVSGEFANLEADLRRMYSLLSTSPADARDMSMRLGNSFHALPRMARSMRKVTQQAEASAVQAQRAAAKESERAAAQEEREAFDAERDAERAKAEEKKKERGQLEAVWQEELSTWNDVLAQQLAFSELAVIRNSFIVAEGRSSQKLCEALQSLRKKSVSKADEMRATESLAAQREARQETLTACQQQIDQSGLSGNHTVGHALSSAGDLSPAELSDTLVKVAQELDNAVVDESCRREVVRSTYLALQQAGFVVDKPRHVPETDEVVVFGRKPAGAEAIFRVEINGSLQYKFDHYRGSACKKDIDTVLPLLESVYGISLSNERVIWVNPDDEQQDARPRPTNTMEK